MTTDTLEIKCRTSIEEKIKRFEHINGVFMEKYFELVWFARSDENELLQREQYEVLNKLKDIANKFKEEVEGLYGNESDWHHGFNSGILAYSRFLSSYIEDQLWPVEDVGYKPKKSEITIFEGHKYVEMDGREQAHQLFPELDT
jgi:hypothetical protein